MYPRGPNDNSATGHVGTSLLELNPPVFELNVVNVLSPSLPHFLTASLPPFLPPSSPLSLSLLTDWKVSQKTFGIAGACFLQVMCPSCIPDAQQTVSSTECIISNKNVRYHRSRVSICDVFLHVLYMLYF